MDAKQATEALAAALVETVADQLKRGMDQRAVWEACRDHLSQRYGFGLVAAANLTRAVFQVAAESLGLDGPYTADEMETIRTIVHADCV